MSVLAFSRALLVRACQAALGLLACSATWADATPPSRFSTEIGVGHEIQSSPLIRLSPQGNLLSVEGMQQLSNSNLQASVQGFDNWQLGNGLELALSADAHQKRVAGASDADFGNFSVHPAVHWARTWGTLGWGLSYQQMQVGRRPFRTVRSTQLDWTFADATGNHWALIAEAGYNQHPEEFADLDAHTASLVMQRHIAHPVAGLESLEISAYLNHEKNARDIDELSSHSVMLVSSISWIWRGLTLSAGVSLQETQFAEQPFAQDPARTDRAVGLDLSVEHEFSPRHTLRLEYNHVRNHSNIELYENQNQQMAIKLRSSW